jgi:hypothetical protein
MELNHRFLFVRQESLPLDHGTVHSNGLTGNHTQISSVRSLCLPVGPRARPSGSRGTRTHKSLSRPTVFKTVSSSGRMTSVQSCGSWNRTNITMFRASRPTVRRSRKKCCVSSGGRNRTYGLLIQSQASLPTATTPELHLHLKSALRELNPPRQLGRLAPLPLGQGHRKRKE